MSDNARSRTLLWVLVGGAAFFIFVLAVFTLVYVATAALQQRRRARHLRAERRANRRPPRRADFEKQPDDSLSGWPSTGEWPSMTSWLG